MLKPKDTTAGYATKTLMHLTGADLELILTRALCVAASYGVTRAQEQQHRAFEATAPPVSQGEYEAFQTKEETFLAPLLERLGTG